MNEQSRKLEAVRNRCRTSSRVISVLQIVTIVGIVLALVGAIVCITQRGMIDEHVRLMFDPTLVRHCHMCSGAV